MFLGHVSVQKNLKNRLRTTLQKDVLQFLETIQKSVSSNTNLNFILNYLASPRREKNIFLHSTHGNYWNDYTTRYPSATNDGTVWNTPYTIDGEASAQDNYPLVNPA